jgi:hypothetical protein
MPLAAPVTMAIFPRIDRLSFESLVTSFSLASRSLSLPKAFVDP